MTSVSFTDGPWDKVSTLWSCRIPHEYQIDTEGVYLLQSTGKGCVTFQYFGKDNPPRNDEFTAARYLANEFHSSKPIGDFDDKPINEGAILRFSDRARRVMQLANQEAQRLNHEYIDTHHILLGLVKGGSGVAAMVLSRRRVGLRDIRLKVEEIVHSGPTMVILGKLPQTPHAKKVTEYAIEEARNLNHNYVGTEHLLLGLIREQEGVAAQVLVSLGLKLEDVREEVIHILHGEDPHPDDVADDIKRIVEEESPSEFVGGMLVSKDTLCFHLIPQVAMQRLCERIALGEQTKGKDAWNALSDNQHVLDSREALARRLGHLINHSYHLLAKIQNKEPWTEEDEKEASAVMWGGMFAICSINQQRKQVS